LKNEEVTKEEPEVRGEFSDDSSYKLPQDLGLLMWPTIKPQESSPKSLTRVNGRNFYMIPASMCGMIHICSN